MKKIFIVASDGMSLLNFRGSFIKYLVKSGLEVTCVSIEPESEMKDRLLQLGANYLQVEGSRVGISLNSGFRMIREYKKVFLAEKPDICFLYMSKPIAFGGYAAVSVGLNHINILVNGLENAYYRSGIKDYIVRIVMSQAYKYVSRRSDNVFFQNHDDLAYLVDHKIIKSNNATVVGGSGVDMEYFQREELPDEPVVLMVARLLWSKGIREYLEAVSKLKIEYPETKVMLVGGLDHNDESLSEEELNRCIQESNIEYCGFANDVRPYLKKCSIFVLPSYHEGLPRSVIEAMAVGRPIVTTDVPGCRETVIDGENGFLVPARDSNVLYERLRDLVVNSELRKKMAEKSYEMCVNKFEVGIVNSTMLNKINQCIIEE